MRATTALTLTMSNGYCLFCDPDSLPTPITFMTGMVSGTNVSASPSPPDPSVPMVGGNVSSKQERQFTTLWAIQQLSCGSISRNRRLSTGEKGLEFSVPPCDGDIPSVSLTGS